MFYANFILKKRGPLSRIWLAAHWDKKLTKAHIFETDIEGSVLAILSPELKLALRTSSHLLLGVVRIYSRKAKYLLADCNEALIKIKLAFRPGMVDLPAENREASLTTINIREDFTSFDLDVTDFNEIDFHARFAVNQSRPEDITLREEVACVEYVGDDGFVDGDDLGGPITFEAVQLFLDRFKGRQFERLVDYFSYLDALSPKNTEDVSLLRTPQKMTRYASLADSGFGSPSVWLDSLSPSFGDGSGNLYRGSGDFGFNPGITTIPDVNLDDIMFEQNTVEPEVQPSELLREQERGHSEDELGKLNETTGQNQFDTHSVGDDDYDDCNYDDDGDDYDTASNAMGGTEDHKLFSEEVVLNQEEPLLYEDPKDGAGSRAKASVSAESLKENNAFGGESHNSISRTLTNDDITTLIENDPEVFALGPVEVNVNKERRSKRKRRLIIDEPKVISSETMKTQLSDSSELVTPLDLAPPTKKLMRWKEFGGVDKLFVLPATSLVDAKLFKLFCRNLYTTSMMDDDGDDDDAIAAHEGSVIERKGRPPELKRGSSEDANIQLCQSILSAVDAENVAPGEADLSISIDCSSSLPFDDADTSGHKCNPRRVDGDGACLMDDPVNCLENLPELPDVGLNRGSESASRTDGSPSRKRHKKSHRRSDTESPEPRGVGAPSVLNPVTSDFEDDAANEDAIFDVEPQPTCSERANLRQELEEAELEEKLWNRRSTQMQHILHRRLETQDIISFKQLTTRNNRKQAASKFYTILVLKKAQSINVGQHAPYGDIEISRGSAFGCIV